MKTQVTTLAEPNVPRRYAILAILLSTVAIFWFSPSESRIGFSVGFLGAVAGLYSITRISDLHSCISAYGVMLPSENRSNQLVMVVANHGLSTITLFIRTIRNTEQEDGHMTIHASQLPLMHQIGPSDSLAVYLPAYCVPGRVGRLEVVYQVIPSQVRYHRKRIVTFECNV